VLNRLSRTVFLRAGGLTITVLDAPSAADVSTAIDTALSADQMPNINNVGQTSNYAARVQSAVFFCFAENSELTSSQHGSLFCFGGVRAFRQVAVA
jgi:hypothetical protein